MVSIPNVSVVPSLFFRAYVIPTLFFTGQSMLVQAVNSMIIANMPKEKCLMPS
jgi:hypothetical protein